jgi:alcohol dehydrogenase
MDSFSFQIPTQIHVGRGKIQDLRNVKLPGKKPVIVTSGTSIKKFGYLDTLRIILSELQIESVIFDSVVQNPTKRNVEEIVEVFRENQCDFLIGFGGGSSIDAAKAAAAMLTNEGDLWDYVQIGTGKRKAFVHDPIPLIAIPTTAGTGTEGNATAVITNEAPGEKVGIGCCFPRISLVDPELTINISPKYTAFQGFDALFHCMEAFIAKKAIPISNPLALDGVKIIFNNLATAVNHGENMDARSNMAWGATLGGMVICLSSCTTAHNIEHSLSGIKPAVVHGAGLIIISSAFHRLGAKRIPEKYAALADAIGISMPNQTIQEKAHAFLDAFEQLKFDCGVGKLCLRDYGFLESDFDEIIEKSHVIAGGAFSRDLYEITDSDLRTMLLESF